MHKGHSYTQLPRARAQEIETQEDHVFSKDT
jgi:hypothetical protein